MLSLPLPPCRLPWGSGSVASDERPPLQVDSLQDSTVWYNKCPKESTRQIYKNDCRLCSCVLRGRLGLFFLLPPAPSPLLFAPGALLGLLLRQSVRSCKWGFLQVNTVWYNECPSASTRQEDLKERLQSVLVALVCVWVCLSCSPALFPLLLRLGCFWICGFCWASTTASRALFNAVWYFRLPW